MKASMISKRFLLVAGLLTLCALAPAPSITIDGAFVKPQSLDAVQIAALPHVAVTATEEHGDGTPAHYSGVLLSTLLGAAGVPTGKAVKGAAARTYVVVHAADGYSVVYSLSELNSATANCPIIIADRRDGVPLDDKLGPFRLLAPCDPTQARWVHEVTGFTIVTLPELKTIAVASASCRTPNTEAAALPPKGSPTMPPGPPPVGFRVLVLATINPDGSLAAARIQQSSGNMTIDRAALQATKESNFTPKIVNCKPVIGTYIFTADFSPAGEP
jgi:TonB family protein